MWPNLDWKEEEKKSSFEKKLERKKFILMSRTKTHTPLIIYLLSTLRRGEATESKKHDANVWRPAAWTWKLQLAQLIHPVYRPGVQIRSREASPWSLAPPPTPATGAETGATSLQPCSRASEQPLFVKGGADVLHSGTLSLWVTYLQRRGKEKNASATWE